MPNKYQYLGSACMVFGVIHLANCGVVQIFYSCYQCYTGYSYLEETEISDIEFDANYSKSPIRPDGSLINRTSVHYMDAVGYLLTKSNVATPGNHAGRKKFDFEERSLHNSQVVEMTKSQAIG